MSYIVQEVQILDSPLLNIREAFSEKVLVDILRMSILALQLARRKSSIHCGASEATLFSFFLLFINIDQELGYAPFKGCLSTS